MLVVNCRGRIWYDFHDSGVMVIKKTSGQGQKLLDYLSASGHMKEAASYYAGNGLQIQVEHLPEDFELEVARKFSFVKITDAMEVGYDAKDKQALEDLN